MKAYLIAVETVHDEAMFAEYRANAPRPSTWSGWPSGAR